VIGSGALKAPRQPNLAKFLRMPSLLSQSFFCARLSERSSGAHNALMGSGWYSPSRTLSIGSVVMRDPLKRISFQSSALARELDPLQHGDDIGPRHIGVEDSRLRRRGSGDR
jgi:hypothetical protein